MIVSTVWGSSSAAPKGRSLREIQALEEETSASVPSAPIEEPSAVSMTPSELSEQLKVMLSGGRNAKAPAPAPATAAGTVWGQKEAAKAKSTKSLREIQEEEARVEAESAAQRAAAASVAATTLPAAGSWARAASKGVPLPYAGDATSLRAIQV